MRRVSNLVRVAALAMVITPIWLFTTTAHASAETTLSIAPGAGEGFVPNRHIPIVATVSSDHLLRGVLVFRVGAGGLVDQRNALAEVNVPIEVSGGTTKEIVAVVPTFALGSEPQPGGGAWQMTMAINAQLYEGDAVLASQDTQVTMRDYHDPVGVLTELALPSVPRHAKLRFSTGEADLVAVRPSVLAAGAAALESFGTIAGTRTDIESLDAIQRAALLVWIERGGHLLIDESVGGASIAGLPDTWQPMVSGWALSGAGDIRLTGGRLAGGRWVDVLDATSSGMLPRPATGDAGPQNRGGRPGPGPVENSMAKEAGVQLPELSVMIMVLGFYLLAAGPLAFVVLRRLDRRTLAWVVVPLVAALFSAGLVVAGSRFHAYNKDAHATVVEVGPGGAIASSTALVSSSGGGAVTLSMPLGWSQLGDSRNVDRRYRPVNQFVASAQAVVAEPRLDPGEFASVRAAGPVEQPGQLNVRAESRDGRNVTGIVRNDLGVDVREVVVIVDSKATRIGDLQAAQEKTFSIDTNPDKTRPVSPELLLWPCTPTCLDGPVNSDLWWEFAGRADATLHSPGLVVAVGWSDRMASAIRNGDTSIRTGRTAFVGRTGITVSSNDISAALRIEWARDTDLRPEPDPADEMRINGYTFRVLFPPNVDGRVLDPSQVVIDFPASVGGLAVVVNGHWQTLEKTGGRHTYDVPAEAVSAGVVYIRLAGDANVTGGPAALAQGWSAHVAQGGDL